MQVRAIAFLRSDNPEGIRLLRRGRFHSDFGETLVRQRFLDGHFIERALLLEDVEAHFASGHIGLNGRLLYPR